ncbi:MULTISPECIES: hypothetical protein [unclassified Streptomyces]|uniref:hypothetical protein n=1 Tax=Streptomyces TaxID=1883 RepID=UPI000AB8E1D7|nr:MULTISPECIES: hypothetical protein [unclassified Streptomyces]
MFRLSIKNDCLNAELHTESGHSTEVRSDSPRRSQADHASASLRSRSEHAQVLTATATCLSLEIEDSPLTGCLTSRFSWSLTLSPQVSDKIRAYRPRLPCAQWAPVAGLVRATVAAAAPANCAQARRMLYAVGRLAVWAEQVRLVRDPALWLRHEIINAFIATGHVGPDDNIRRFRSCLRHVSKTVIWAANGVPPLPRAPLSYTAPPYHMGELAKLRAWAEQLPDRAQLDGLALLAMGAGCGLTPSEALTMRGTDVDASSGVPVLDERALGRLVVCHVDWAETLTKLAKLAGSSYMFKPQRDLKRPTTLISSWISCHSLDENLPKLSAHRLQATWLAGLLAQGISPPVIAAAAGMSSAAALAPYRRPAQLPGADAIRLRY